MIRDDVHSIVILSFKHCHVCVIRPFFSSLLKSRHCLLSFVSLFNAHSLQLAQNVTCLSSCPRSRRVALQTEEVVGGGAAADLRYAALRCDVQPLGPGTDEYKGIADLIAKNNVRMGVVMMDVEGDDD